MKTYSEMNDGVQSVRQWESDKIALPTAEEISVNKTKSQMGFKTRLAVCTALLGAIGVVTGCVSHDDGYHHQRVYAEPQPVYVERGVQPVYVYYPGYQVYYSSNTRQYVYQDGRSWVRRSAPPHVSVDVLFASPSVRLAFHDSPSIHHAMVVKQYPKNWAPPGAGYNHGSADRDDGDGRGDHR